MGVCKGMQGYMGEHRGRQGTDGDGRGRLRMARRVAAVQVVMLWARRVAGYRAASQGRTNRKTGRHRQSGTRTEARVLREWASG